LIINGLLIKDPQPPHRDGLPPNDDDDRNDDDDDDGLVWL